MNSAAKVGNVAAMVFAGERLRGAAMSAIPDYQRASVWYEQAATATGNSSAMVALAGFYRNGLGVELSFVEAVMWYRLAIQEWQPRSGSG
jgi:TPR repeat protein